MGRRHPNNEGMTELLQSHVGGQKYMCLSCKRMLYNGAVLRFY
jgi:hypothetical protein